MEVHGFRTCYMHVKKNSNSRIFEPTNIKDGYWVPLAESVTQLVVDGVLLD